MAETKQIDITRTYKQELESELAWRKNDERTRIVQAIREAREQGDLSENADYKAAREEQVVNEARIQEIENILKNARIIESIFIKVRYLDLKKDEEYEICGAESDPFKKKISNDSPLARAVAGHKKGDKFIMTTESGKDIRLELLSIK